MIITYDKILAYHFNHIVIFSQDIFKFDQVIYYLILDPPNFAL